MVTFIYIIPHSVVIGDLLVLSIEIKFRNLETNLKQNVAAIIDHCNNIPYLLLLYSNLYIYIYIYIYINIIIYNNII